MKNLVCKSLLTVACTVVLGLVVTSSSQAFAAKKMDVDTTKCHYVCVKKGGTSPAESECPGTDWDNDNYRCCFRDDTGTSTRDTDRCKTDGRGRTTCDDAPTRAKTKCTADQKCKKISIESPNTPGGGRYVDCPAPKPKTGNTIDDMLKDLSDIK